jgi:hypothetical protein
MEERVNWEAIGAVGQVVGAIAVVVTLAYLSIQIRSSARATEAQVSASLSAEMERLMVALSQDDSLVEAMLVAQRGGEITETQTAKLTYWFGGFLRVCESHIIQRNLGSTNIQLEKPISMLLRQYAEISLFRSTMVQVVKRGFASDEFLAWLDSAVLNTEDKRGAA